MQASPSGSGIHVAIIMDGNGRWAQARGMPRTAGHRAGSHAVRKAVEAAPNLGVKTLTLFAFSSDNWKRPVPEVRALMELLERYLDTESRRCVKNGVRFSAIGRRDRFSAKLVKAISRAEQKTANGTRLHLRIALDYSAKTAIALAAAQLKHSPDRDPGDLTDALEQALRAQSNTADVDLLIRTGGEQRISDFLLWECAYAELFFTPIFWPDFDATTFTQAVEEFRQRERRFGKVTLPDQLAVATSS